MPKVNTIFLALRRKRLGYEQKQIAVLLGHKTKYEICRYENGQRTPGFKTAIKLSILYGLPVSILFDAYFNQCKNEMEKRLSNSGIKSKIDLEDAKDADFCSYLELMNSTKISERSSDKIRRHIKILVEERSKKILGN